MKTRPDFQVTGGKNRVVAAVGLNLTTPKEATYNRAIFDLFDDEAFGADQFPPEPEPTTAQAISSATENFTEAAGGMAAHAAQAASEGMMKAIGDASSAASDAAEKVKDMAQAAADLAPSIEIDIFNPFSQPREFFYEEDSDKDSPVAWTYEEDEGEQVETKPHWLVEVQFHEAEKKKREAEEKKRLARKAALAAAALARQPPEKKPLSTAWKVSYLFMAILAVMLIYTVFTSIMGPGLDQRYYNPHMMRRQPTPLTTWDWVKYTVMGWFGRDGLPFMGPILGILALPLAWWGLPKAWHATNGMGLVSAYRYWSETPAKKRIREANEHAIKQYQAYMNSEAYEKSLIASDLRREKARAQIEVQAQVKRDKIDNDREPNKQARLKKVDELLNQYLDKADSDEATIFLKHVEKEHVDWLKANKDWEKLATNSWWDIFKGIKPRGKDEDIATWLTEGSQQGIKTKLSKFTEEHQNLSMLLFGAQMGGYIPKSLSGFLPDSVGGALKDQIDAVKSSTNALPSFVQDMLPDFLKNDSKNSQEPAPY